MKLWDEVYAMYDSPIPDDVRVAIHKATHPPKGSRRASASAYECVRYHARRANAARKAHDKLDLYWSEHWLNAALNAWRECRQDEKAREKAA